MAEANRRALSRTRRQRQNLAARARSLHAVRLERKRLPPVEPGAKQVIRIIKKTLLWLTPARNAA
jgi:hypothetical protein